MEQRLVSIALFSTLALLGYFMLSQHKQIKLSIGDIYRIDSLIQDKNKGRRNTYRDFIEHLIVDHGMDVARPTECINDNTDIDAFRQEYIDVR